MKQLKTPLYDAVADIYDASYLTAGDLHENAFLRSILEPLVIHGKDRVDVLDFGAGTGLFLDLFPELAPSTVCLDPSEKMLQKLAAKHPYATTVVGDHGTLRDMPQFDVTVSLFGALGYIRSDEVHGALCDLRQCTKDVMFLMFYAPNHGVTRPIASAGLSESVTLWTVDAVDGVCRRVGATPLWTVQMNTSILTLWKV